MSEPIVYQETDWPHGLRCGRCETLFAEGDAIQQVPEAMFEDGTPILLVICTNCIKTEIT